MQPRKISRYGWNPDHPDARDHCLVAAPIALPKIVDLRTTGCLPPVYDQGDLGSCTGNSIAALIDYERKRQGKPFINPARLFIYYNERVLEGTVAQDAGAEIRDGIKSIAQLGVCTETEWPYDPDQFTAEPPPKCYVDALQFKTLAYSRVTQTEYYIRHCIGILARPVVFGFSVYDAFESPEVAATGIVPMPSPTDKPIGGHAVLAVGYNDTTRRALVRNSWGPKWGQGGYFELPYDYLTDTNLTQDLWTVLTEQ